MKPGERIRLIKEAGASLSTRAKGDIQLIFDQHGVDTYDWEMQDAFNSPETVTEYCTNRLAKSSDDQLAAIHDYVIGDDAAPAPKSLSDRTWGVNPVRVFISHCHEDAAFVGEVSRLLKAHHGIDAFVAHDQIEPSAIWRQTIRRALQSCDFMVVVVHDRFHESQWCDQEVGWAFGRDIPVMPVRRAYVAGPRVDGFLEEHQDCTLDPSKGPGDWWLAHQILEQVVRDSRTHSLGVKALVEAFVTSFSFNRTRQLWGLIAQEPYLEAEQLRRLEFAVAIQRQVYEANVDGEMAPAVVQALVAKFEPPSPDAPADPWAFEKPPF